MNLLTKLFVLATFLGSLFAIDSKEPIKTPDWFNNPPQEYTVSVGSTIEKAFIQVLFNYSTTQQDSTFIYSSSVIIDTTAIVGLSNTTQTLLNAHTIGNIEIQGIIKRFVEETGIGVESEYLDNFTQIIKVVFINEEYNMRAVINYNFDETGLGEDSKFIDNISHSYENCNLNDLIENVKTHGYDIKYEIRGDRYFFLLGETNNK
ncbi:hypothetical protein EB821_01890 [Candidatus Marinimicrobia bacterium PRS2]|nr:hypothetical protein EB821_01890 [Candidatus Marinimicrobia bacterium PRS2]